MIEVTALIKDYMVREQSQGWKGSLRSLFSTKYKVKRALNGVYLKIQDHEACGIIGPNGAGKSTLIKILTGILQPTSGEVAVNGINPSIDNEDIAHQIGVVFGQRSQLWWDLPAHESFRIFQAIYRVPEEKFQHNLKKYTELLEVGPYLNTPVRQLSLGQRMRCEIIGALLHNPSILLLDEPTIGLDVSIKYKLRNFLRYLVDKKICTILLTSHDLQDIEAICDRLVVVNHGEIIADGVPSQLVKRGQGKRELEIECHPDTKLEVPALSHALDVKVQDSTLIIQIPVDPFSLKVTLNEALDSQLTVVDIRVKEPSIDDFIRSLMATVTE